MKIAIAIPDLTSPFAGGSLRMYRQAILLQEQGVDVDVFAWKNSNDSLVAVDDSSPQPLIRLLGSELCTGPSAGRMSKTVRHLSLLVSAVRQLRESKPSVLHLLSYGSFGFVLHVAASLLRIPVTVETTLAGGDDPVSIKAGRYGRLRVILMRRSRGLVSISPRLDQLAAEAGWQQSSRHIIPNSVDTNHFKPAGAREKAVLRKGLGLPADAFILANVGAIRPRKGQLHLIETLPTLLDCNSDVLAVLIGPENKDQESINYAGCLRSRADDLRVSNNVKFAGMSSEIATWLRASDMFVFTSEQEGFGTAQIEAMSCGLPVVAMSIPGVTDFIIESQREGVVVKNCSELAGSVCQLIIDSELRDVLSTNGRAAVLERFSQDSVTRQYLCLFESIVGASPRRSLRNLGGPNCDE